MTLHSLSYFCFHISLCYLLNFYHFSTCANLNWWKVLSRAPKRKGRSDAGLPEYDELSVFNWHFGGGGGDVLLLWRKHGHGVCVCACLSICVSEDPGSPAMTTTPSHGQSQLHLSFIASCIFIINAAWILHGERGRKKKEGNIKQKSHTKVIRLVALV